MIPLVRRMIDSVYAITRRPLTVSEAGRALGAQTRADHRARVADKLAKLRAENTRTDINRLGWKS